MYRYFTTALCLLMVFLAQISFAQPDNVKIVTDRENYSLGFRFGKELRDYDIRFKPEIFWHGLFTPIDEITPQFTLNQIEKALNQLDSHRPLPRLSEELQKERLTLQNYSLGYRLGHDFLKYRLELKPQALLDGVFDAYADRNSRLELEEIANILRQIDNRNNDLLKHTEFQHFLSANAASDDVTVLKSGLQYRVLTEGTGTIPQKSDSVLVHFRSTNIHGVEIDSSHPLGIPRPRKYKVAEVVPGWSEALLRMKEGSRWVLYVPAYLTDNDGLSSAGQTIIVDLELIKILP